MFPTAEAVVGVPIYIDKERGGLLFMERTAAGKSASLFAEVAVVADYAADVCS